MSGSISSNEGQQDQSGTIEIWSPDNPNNGSLSALEWHVLQASYTVDDKAAANQSLTWVLSTSSQEIVLATSTGRTGADGTMTNAVRGLKIGASGMLRVTSDSGDTSEWVPLFFNANNTNVPGQGSMVITSGDGNTLALSSWHPLSVTYKDGNGQNIQDGTEVTWTGYPSSNRFKFSDGQGNITNKSTTSNGVATIQVKVRGGSDIDHIPLAVITTTATNPQSGVHDHADHDLVVSFQVSPNLYPIDYNTYRSIVSFNKRVRFLVMHYTAENFPDSVKSLTQELSVHYLVPDPTDITYQNAGFTNVQIFNLVSETERAWHAGASYWQNRTNLNDCSIGIENVNLANDTIFPDYNPQQMDALKQLALNIIQRYPDITPTHVVAHSDIAWNRKSDPGPKFPWKTFYEAGIGAWYDDATKQKYLDDFNANGLPGQADLLKRFHLYGYDTADATTDAMYQKLVRAFQLHFRPENYDGVMDVETGAILYALVEKYF
jgi:N-acetylmuramoyl-L-alanine amidase